MVSLFSVLVLIFGKFQAVAAIPEQGPLADKLTALEEKIENAPCRDITFREERHFPFRKSPVELQGVIRLWSGKGFSIHYPGNQTVMISDHAGLLLRKFSGDGSFRERAVRTEDLEQVRMLQAAFEFDRAELEKRFELEWREMEDEWAISMTPRNAEPMRLKKVVVEGKDLEITKISIDLSAVRKIVILPREEHVLDAFGEEDQARYFRGPSR